MSAVCLDWLNNFTSLAIQTEVSRKLDFNEIINFGSKEIEQRLSHW